MLLAAVINGKWVIDVVITAILYLVAIYFFRNLINKKVLIPFTIAVFICKTLSSIFAFELTSDLIDLIALGVVVAYTSIYSQEIRRKLMAGKGLRARSEDSGSEVANKIVDAVLFLSANKTGAIITFEMNDNLDHYIQSGEQINAPVNANLIKTIFYEGTALHDGAVVIRGNTMCAASVYFTPSVKPLIGKYGSRHRAALGISEVTDALTVIVSEETGRISFSKSGELIPCSRDSFAQQIKEYLKKA